MTDIQKLKIKIFADGADFESINKLNTKNYIRGFTTNPSLMKKAGIKNYKEFALKILSKIKDDPKLFFIGGLILFIYGVGMYLKKENRTPIQQETFATPIKKNYVGLILKGFLLNFINIGLLAFWLLMVLGISPSLEMDEHRIFTFFTTIIITYFITDLGKILLAKQLKKKLTPNVIRKINRAIGIVLIIFGVLLFLKGIIPQKTLNIKNFIEHFQN